jgi:hypothetical protein
MSSLLVERERIRVEEACDAIKLALEEAERDEITFSDEANPFVLDEVAELARRVGYEVERAGLALTLRRKPLSRGTRAGSTR